MKIVVYIKICVCRPVLRSSFSRENASVYIKTFDKKTTRVVQQEPARSHSPELCLLIPPDRPRPDLITSANGPLSARLTEKSIFDQPVVH